MDKFTLVVTEKDSRKEDSMKKLYLDNYAQLKHVI